MDMCYCEECGTWQEEYNFIYQPCIDCDGNKKECKKQKTCPRLECPWCQSNNIAHGQVISRPFGKVLTYMAIFKTQNNEPHLGCSIDRQHMAYIEYPEIDNIVIRYYRYYRKHGEMRRRLLPLPEGVGLEEFL